MLEQVKQPHEHGKKPVYSKVNIRFKNSVILTDKYYEFNKQRACLGADL